MKFNRGLKIKEVKTIKELKELQSKFKGSNLTINFLGQFTLYKYIPEHKYNLIIAKLIK